MNSLTKRQCTDDIINLPLPPENTLDTHQSEDRKNSKSPTSSQSNSDFYSNRSLTYSLSSQSTHSSPQSLSQIDLDSEYDSFTDIIHVKRRGVHIENETSCHCCQMIKNDFYLDDFLRFLGTASIIALTYALLFFLFGPDLLLPGGELFTLFVVWTVSFGSGKVTKLFKLPPLLGMLIAGLLLGNLTPQSWLNLPETWKTTIRTSSLTVILLRSGLELNVKALMKSGLAALRLTLLPGLTEAFFCALISYFLFGMPTFLALSLGFILAAVSPAVVVNGMLDLKKQGYGVKKGVPSLIVAAASFDDIVAISGFTICIGLAVQNKKDDFILSILHGPLSLIVGVVFGIMGGIIIVSTTIWEKQWKRSYLTFLLGMLFTFGLDRINFEGSGSLAAMVMGIVGSVCWRNHYPKSVTGNYCENLADEIEKDIAVFWYIFFEPLLFGIIGMSLDFRIVQTQTIPKSFILILLGLSVRLPIAYLSTYGRDFTQKERLFVALAWSPKATVQAALCSVPMDVIKSTLSIQDKSYESYITWAHEILTTAILSILVSAPIGLLCIQILGPKLLECDGTDDEAVMHKADESIHSGTSGLSSRKSIVLSHLANIEERLVELERTVAGPEAIDILFGARKSIIDTRSLVSLVCDDTRDNQI